MKTNGATWKKYIDSWPDGQWYDEAEIKINGRPWEDFSEDETAALNADAVVEIRYGIIYDKDESSDPIGTLVGNFLKWKKAQSESIIACAIPKEKEQEFLAMLGQLGGRKI